MKVLRKIIKIDEDLCNGCGDCVPGCAEAALQIVDGKAKLVAELYCDGLGACLGECPTGALTLVEREVDEFDEDAVHERVKMLEEQSTASQEPAPTLGCGCPGSMERSFGTIAPSLQHGMAAPGKAESSTGNQPSALTHWPVKLELVRPEAQFLQGADLLVAADCAPAAAGNFHSTHLRGKVLTLGCPKFGPAPQYLQKLTEILKIASPASVTVLRMEVPCCQGLAGMVEEAARLANYQGPVKDQVLGLEGQMKKKEPALAPMHA